MKSTEQLPENLPSKNSPLKFKLPTASEFVKNTLHYTLDWRMVFLLTAFTTNLLPTHGENTLNPMDIFPDPHPFADAITRNGVMELRGGYYHQGMDEVMVAVNQGTGLPEYYTGSDGKTKRFFDSELVRQTREKAIITGEHQILTIIPAIQRYGLPSDMGRKPDPEHPYSESIPSSALTPEELRTRGINIIQSGRVKLHIKNQAFNSGGILESYASGQRRLAIVLLDGPSVSYNLTLEPAYAAVRSYLPRNNPLVDEYRRSQIKVNEDTIDRIRTSGLLRYPAIGYRDIQIVTNDSQGAEMDLRWAKADVFMYKNVLTDAQLANEMLDDEFHEEAGTYITPSPATRGTGVIFIAVGDTLLRMASVKAFFDPDGSFHALPYYFVGRGNRGYLPNEKQSHPDPNSFKRNPNAHPSKPDSYPYGGQTPGQILRHEILHDLLIAGRSFSDHNWNEYDTDILAMDTIRQAWERWKNSGYKDDSGYPFVFQLENGLYIQT